MQRTLFQFDGAPPSWRVRLGLAFKGLEVEIRSLRYSDRDHDAAEILAQNPRGTLPILRESNTSLHNSLAILAWLDRAYPKAPLFGANPDEAAQIWQIAMDGYDFFREANRQLLTVVFSSDVAPVKKRDPKLSGLMAGAKLAHVECEGLERRLAEGRRFLCSDRPNGADAMIFPEVRLIQRAISTKPAVMRQAGFDDLAEHYPQLSKWMDRLEAMPAVLATIPKHWGRSAN